MNIIHECLAVRVALHSCERRQRNETYKDSNSIHSKETHTASLSAVCHLDGATQAEFLLHFFASLAHSLIDDS
jgi:hypothetical protein